MMKFTYDQLADALYVQLSEKPVDHSHRINFNVMLDVDSEDQVIGIEIINVRKRGLNPYELATQYHIADSASS